LDKNEGSGELPGVEEIGSDEYLITSLTEYNGDPAIMEGVLEVKAASVEEVFIEGEK
jgi:hypothetical protein